jgi:hypothetical protein
MAQLLAEDAPPEVPPEEARLREQIRQLEELEEQGVPNLRKTILDLRDQVAYMRMDRIVDPWLMPDYQFLLEDERAFRAVDNATLRPVLLQFVRRVEFNPATEEIGVVLR